MFLTYTLPNAEILIKTGVKIHTMREDKKNKWKVGMKIHHTTDTDIYNRKAFLVGVVKSIQKVEMLFDPMPGLFNDNLKLVIDGEERKFTLLITLAENDGFAGAKDLIRWFFRKKGRTEWSGKIIHFTDLKY